MRRQLLLICTIIPTLAFTGYGLFAIWPFHDIIGKAMAGLIVVCILCVAALVLNFTWRRVRAPHLVVERDVVVMLHRDGTYAHLSAEHVAAGVMPQVTVKELPPPSSDIDTVKDFYALGMTIKDVAERTNLSESKVQRILADEGVTRPPGRRPKTA